ncbi:hypothetical protein BGZ76_006785 [Entomortierella beljakovae]|nr:hypothetical protein BGZ76_006785 [Entomortierella beljakovae]
MEGYIKLSHFTLKGSGFSYIDEDQWGAFAHFIEQHCSTLEHIAIIEFKFVDLTLPLCDAISACNKLQSLTLQGTLRLPNTPTFRFWEACRNIDKLVLIDTLIPSGDMGIATRVQSLAFTNCSVGIRFPDFLGFFPELRHLQWGIRRETGIKDQFRIADLNLAITNGQLPHLSSFDVHGYGIKDRDIATTLNSTRPITSFCMPYSEFGKKSCQALVKHVSTIKTLDLSGWGCANSSSIQKILSSMTALENLKAGQIKCMDIVNGAAWTALNLRNLEIDFLIQGESNNDDDDDTKVNMDFEVHQHIVYSRLGSLTQLNTLSIKRHQDPNNSPRREKSLDLRLKSGLGTLSTLKKLAALNYEYTNQKWGEEEIQWIIENWPSMRRMTGNFSFDPTKYYKLKNSLNSHGILVYA